MGGPERRVCATVIGYDRARWNGKHHHLGSVFYHGARILLRQPYHNTYLGMCGHDTGCGGSSYGIFGFPSSSHSRTTWTVEKETTFISSRPITTPIWGSVENEDTAMDRAMVYMAIAQDLITELNLR